MYTQDQLENMEISKLRFLARIQLPFCIAKAFSLVGFWLSFGVVVAVPVVSIVIGSVGELLLNVPAKRVTLEMMVDLCEFALFFSAFASILGALAAMPMLLVSYKGSDKKDCIKEILSF